MVIGNADAPVFMLLLVTFFAGILSITLSGNKQRASSYVWTNKIDRNLRKTIVSVCMGSDHPPYSVPTRAGRAARWQRLHVLTLKTVIFQEIKAKMVSIIIYTKLISFLFIKCNDFRQYL